MAVLTASCVVSNYALIWLPNVKLMDLIVFVSGLKFGKLVGVLVGALTWVIYGLFNPYGFFLPIWLACIIGETFYGLVGGVLRSVFREKFKLFFVPTVIAVLVTIIYDLWTNFVFAIMFATDQQAFALMIASGIPFMFIHTFANTVLFTLGTYPLSFAFDKVGTIFQGVET